MFPLNETHDATRRSWVRSANDQASDFPIQNLPFGRFRRIGDDASRCGVAIGDQVLDLQAIAAAGLLDGISDDVVKAVMADDLLPLLRLGGAAVSPLRARLSELLRSENEDRSSVEPHLVAQADVEMLLPTAVRQFSDMCVSTYHIGRHDGNDERGEPICPPVFRTLPVGYDGRASSVVISGTPVRRPNGQWTRELGGKADPQYGPEPRQDYELEVGAWFGGPGNPLGQPLGMEAAAASVFGLCLLNDWSARGIQLWETMLGPFLGKSLTTTISPWIVTMEALAPFAIPAFQRPEGDPPVPVYLDLAADQQRGGLDIALEARLRTSAMKDGAGSIICATNARYMYWTFAQMFAHHASNGCSMAAGDLIGSGTCSGPALSEAGCLLEANMEGPLKLESGEQRSWLEDGDTVILRGRASRDGFASIGLGTATGTILAAPVDSAAQAG